MSLSNQKIRVASEEISVAIQEHLFEQGYRWSSSGTKTAHTGSPYLYAKENGSITYGYDHDLFEEREFTETIYTTQSKLVVVSTTAVRPKVVLFGKTYFKDELDAALSKLQEARL